MPGQKKNLLGHILKQRIHFLSFQVLGFIRDLYSSDFVRFTSVEEMVQDIMRLAKEKLDLTNQELAA